MVNTQYTVLASFDDSKDYGIHIRLQHRTILSSLKKGQKITPADFIKQHRTKSKYSKTKSTVTNSIYKALSVGLHHWDVKKR